MSCFVGSPETDNNTQVMSLEITVTVLQCRRYVKDDDGEQNKEQLSDSHQN